MTTLSVSSGNSTTRLAISPTAPLTASTVSQLSLGLLLQRAKTVAAEPLPARLGAAANHTAKAPH